MYAYKRKWFFRKHIYKYIVKEKEGIILEKKVKSPIWFMSLIIINAICLYCSIYILGIVNKVDKYIEINGSITKNDKIEFYVDNKYRNIITTDLKVIWYISNETRHISTISEIENYDNSKFIVKVGIDKGDYSGSNYNVNGEIAVEKTSFLRKIFEEKLNIN